METYFVMWRLTHDQKYRDWAWDAAQVSQIFEFFDFLTVKNSLNFVSIFMIMTHVLFVEKMDTCLGFLFLKIFHLRFYDKLC